MLEDDRGDDAEARASRRGALTAMLAGSALGLAALGGASPQAAAKGKKKGNKRKHGRKHRDHGNGKGGNGNAGADLPSVRFVETTTTFESEGVVSAVSTCPSGYLPIGGGFFSSIDNPVLLTSTPRLAQNDWLIEVDGAETGQEMTVTAICLAANDDTEDEDTVGEARSRGKRKRSRKR